MNKILVLILFCIGTFSLQAQTFSVSGMVDEADTGLPLPGVNIIVKNTSNGVVTDFDGNYTINEVSAGDVLVFSYVGFLPQEVTVGENQNVIDVTLKTDAAALEEVVVIGYGTQQRKDITGAVSVVSNETIEELNPIKIEQALQGTAAGVNVTHLPAHREQELM
ncbi:carboxypeptidase-like regulatory domain-containing protein [Salegentibacter sp. T436]|uniref:carboxypeptidase-like regulatory domain-containing protein n=1 Tax=Salegentibacter sp. T436 TaxID=1729720 RepID=UPI000B0156DD